MLRTRLEEAVPIEKNFFFKKRGQSKKITYEANNTQVEFRYNNNHEGSDEWNLGNRTGCHNPACHEISKPKCYL